MSLGKLVLHFLQKVRLLSLNWRLCLCKCALRCPVTGWRHSNCVYSVFHVQHQKCYFLHHCLRSLAGCQGKWCHPDWPGSTSRLIATHRCLFPESWVLTMGRAGQQRLPRWRCFGHAGARCSSAVPYEWPVFGRSLGFKNKEASELNSVNPGVCHNWIIIKKAANFTLFNVVFFF